MKKQEEKAERKIRRLLVRSTGGGGSEEFEENMIFPRDISNSFHRKVKVYPQTKLL